MAARYQGRSNRFRRWAYQANVMKMFERISSPAGRKKIEVLIRPSWFKRSWGTAVGGLRLRDVTARQSVFLEVPLVVLLRPVEGRRRGGLRDDRSRKPPACPQPLLGRLRRRLLLLIVVEDGRTVLRPPVRPLPV